MGTADAVRASLPGPLRGRRRRCWPPATPRRLHVLVPLSAAATMALLYVLVSLSPCAVAGVGSCYRGYFSRFSFDAAAAADSRAHGGRLSSWMADLPDRVNLTDLSIPGTHDTMTYGLDGNERLQCQNTNLSAQMGSGLRYFDIRARLEADELRIYHASGFTGFDLGDVLLDMFDFLDSNPSEAIVMRLKEEGAPVGDANTITFVAALDRYVRTSPVTAPGCERHLHPYSRSDPLPTLGQLRSKILLIQEFGTHDDDDDSASPYGLAWDGDQMALEDLWVIPDVAHLSDKWDAVRDALEAAAAAPADNSRLYLAHTSASVGVLPVEAAAGPLNRTVAGVNDLAGQWLQDHRPPPSSAAVTRTGIVIIDFPGKRLVDAVLRWNEHLAAATGG